MGESIEIEVVLHVAYTCTILPLPAGSYNYKDCRTCLYTAPGCWVHSAKDFPKGARSRITGGRKLICLEMRSGGFGPGATGLPWKTTSHVY
ncbi:hypothetical protein DPMN_035738 [Dreissena polymorpha]|uniref:Uncharacterized protein n=1 Tax=Dreissena polymorpha TaxID=45954 RepID=A0A9D4RKU6_DREPO|nr:hypothetical protein DPMN_035738 [Dreissena polymorpha]